jgi:uncharacterized membrane protein
VVLKKDFPQYHNSIQMKKVLLFLSCSIFISCLNKKQEILPSCKADTEVKISYQSDIKEIISKNCNFCHSNKSHAGGVKLEDLEDVLFWTKSGELYDQIIPFGGNPPRMPKGNTLSDCDISVIKKWINQGLN